MGIFKSKCFGVKCDCCGKLYEQRGTDYSLFVSDEDIESYLEEDDWFIDIWGKGRGKKYYCPECFEMDDDDNMIIDESRRK